MIQLLRPALPLAVSGLLLACGRSDPPAARAPAGPQYVGRDSCARCHARELELWAGSDHDLALQAVSSSSVLGRFDGATHEHFGVVSTFTRSGDGFRVRTDGPDGALADFEVAYAIGVDPLQQYLVPLGRGRHQVLGVCWDARPLEQGGQRWFHLFPDEPVASDDLLHWTGPYQNWNFMCADCHSTDLRRNYQAETDSYTTTWSEIDVSCEACHGPGSTHVEWAEARERGEPAPALERLGLTVLLTDPDRATWDFYPDTPIARRSHTRRTDEPLETCARCHSRRATIDERYVPGARFLDHYQPMLLDEPLYHADGQILDEVYEWGSFVQSKMHAAGVTCTDCHDAHSGELRAQGNALCNRCHLPAKFDAPAHHFHAQEGPGSRCVDCHMATRNYMIVDARHDHGFRVPRPDLTEKLGAPNACNGCHAGESSQWAAQAAAGWWGAARASAPHFGEALHAGRAGAPGAESALDALLRDPSQSAIVRATAARLIGEIGASDALASLELACADRDPLVRAGAADALELLPPAERAHAGAPLLSDPVRAVRIEAAKALAAVPRDAIPEDRRPALEAALDEYRRAQLVDLDRPEAHMNLGELALDLGDLAAAEREYAAAVRLAPRHPHTYANLADVHRMQGREADAESVLRRGLQADPRSADLHLALGLALLRQERRDEARDSLQRSVELAPDAIRGRYVYAVLLQSMGRVGDGLGELKQAYERRPTDLAVLEALVAFSLEAGASADALRYAEEFLALDPANERLEELVSRLRAGR